MTMTTWTVANQKGGVGKTTTAISLAALLARRGNRCLLVDLDPHGSMTSYFGGEPDHMENSVYDLFAKNAGVAHTPIASLIQSTRLECTRAAASGERIEDIHLLPASTSLATVDRRFAGCDGMGLALRRSLEQLKTRYDHAIIDCPPIFGILMLNALAACQKLLIPVQTDYLALKGLERMTHTLNMVAQGGRTVVHPIIIPTMYDSHTIASKRGLGELRERYRETLWDGVIPVDTKFRDASRAGVPLPLLSPDTHGARAYATLLDDLLVNAKQPISACSTELGSATLLAG